jgi:hypothetical protein
VAISGDGSTVVAGAFGAAIAGNRFQGAAYVFVKPGTGWATTTETAKLTASDGAASDSLGSSVAISGDGSTVVAGANGTSGQGAVYVFVKPSTGWGSTTETAKLTASDGAAANGLGWSAAISSNGRTVVAGGAPVNAPRGAVYEFAAPPVD